MSRAKLAQQFFKELVSPTQFPRGKKIIKRKYLTGDESSEASTAVLQGTGQSNTVSQRLDNYIKKMESISLEMSQASQSTTVS